MQSARELFSKYRRQIVGCAVIIAAIALLFMLKNQLSELASVLWPIVVGATIIGFKHELSDLLKRIKRFSKEGMEFGDAQIAAQILSVHVSDALKDVAPNETHSDLIKSRVYSLRRELNMMQPSDATKREYLRL